MTTNTITGRVTEDNRRVNYGTLTFTSSVVLVYFKTGLRQVEGLNVWDLTSGASPIVVHPTSYPALDVSSGNFGVMRSLSSLYVYWRARGYA